MKYMIFLFLILLIVFLYRIYSKRFLLFNKLHKICNEHGYKINIINNFLFTFNQSRHLDFYVETKYKVYCVKLFYLLKKNVDVHFFSLSEYVARGYRIVAVGFIHLKYDPLNEVKKRRRKLPRYDFSYKAKETYYQKECIPVLLMCPVVTMEVTKSVGGKMVPLSPGDYLENVMFSNTSYFLYELEKQSEREG